MAADLKKAAASAAKLLLKQRLYSLQIDVKALKYDKNIIFDTFTGFCGNSCATVAKLETICESDGCTIRREDSDGVLYIILYNEKIRSAGRRSFTLAHEIGHIYLGHMRDGADEEAEAGFFAAHLLMPPVLVQELLKRHKLSAGELAGIFGVSRPAAQYCINSLKKAPEFLADEVLLLKKFGGLLPVTDGPVIDF